MDDKMKQVLERLTEERFLSYLKLEKEHDERWAHLGDRPPSSTMQLREAWLKLAPAIRSFLLSPATEMQDGDSALAALSAVSAKMRAVRAYLVEALAVVDEEETGVH